MLKMSLTKKYYKQSSFYPNIPRKLLERFRQFARINKKEQKHLSIKVSNSNYKKEVLLERKLERFSTTERIKYEESRNFGGYYCITLRIISLYVAVKTESLIYVTHANVKMLTSFFDRQPNLLCHCWVLTIYYYELSSWAYSRHCVSFWLDQKGQIKMICIK